MNSVKVHQFERLDTTALYYLKKIDDLAEAERCKYVTPGSGQAMTYELKYREAQAGGGPLLNAEATALGMSLQEVVDSVLSAHDAWLQVGAAIETGRLVAKRDIRNAQTPGEMYEVLKAFQESLASI